MVETLLLFRKTAVADGGERTAPLRTHATDARECLSYCFNKKTDARDTSSLNEHIIIVYAYLV